MQSQSHIYEVKKGIIHCIGKESIRLSPASFPSSIFFFVCFLSIHRVQYLRASLTRAHMIKHVRYGLHL